MTEIEANGIFRLGHLYGANHGQPSPRKADNLLRLAFPDRPITDDMITLFCNGADDGTREDAFRLHYNQHTGRGTEAAT